MKYIVWGAGEVGRRAIQFLGGVRIECIIDNFKIGDMWGLKIITFQEFISIYGDSSNIILVIASVKYVKEMEEIVLKEKVKKYFIFKNEMILASYMLYGNQIRPSLTESLGKYRIHQYQNIGIICCDEMIPYVISEIWFQNQNADIYIVGQCNTEYTMGCEKITLDECDVKVDCLIVGVEHSNNSIREYFEDGNNYDIIDLFEVEDFEPIFHHPELERFKGIHNDERIFVIGTGPSLTIEDLEILHRHNEICIGVNMIFLVYNRTKWRANYLGVTDLNEKYYDAEILENPGGELILGDGGIHWNQAHYLPGRQYIHSKCREFMPNHIQFSDDITKGVYCGNTVIYDFGIQFAAYLGAKEIYLLGVDFSFTENPAEPMEHFIPDYLSKVRGDTFPLASQEKRAMILKEYESAEIYSRKHGFRIYNATRGGNLEVFERVDFDSLFD